jgi:N utilization substance protein A
MPKNLNYGFTNLLNSVAADSSISSEVMMNLLLDSTTEILSQASGLTLSLDFDREEHIINIYCVRSLNQEALGFGEILEDLAVNLANKSKGFFSEDRKYFNHFLRSVSFNTDTGFFSRQSVAKISENLKSKILDINKAKEFDLFKDREGDLISGVVTRVESGGHIILNLGLGEGFLSKYEIIPGEFFNIGSTVQAYVYEVERSSSKYQIKLTRTRQEFLSALMSSCIPEIESGLIEIKAIARDPGSRAKVAVYSYDPTIDPIGPCIGRDGIRIKSVRPLIANERIDIVKWDPDIAVFISNALGVDINKFILHDDQIVEVVCSDEVLEKIRLGRRQQMRLVSRLTKRRIKLTSVEEDKVRVQMEHEKSIASFAKIGLSEFQTRAFFNANLRDIEDILDEDDESLERILSIVDIKMSANDLKSKAYEIYQQSLVDDYTKYNLDARLVNVPYLFTMEPSFYQSRNISSVEDLALMDSDEIKELFRDYLSDDGQISQDQADEIVLWSRGTLID